MVVVQLETYAHLLKQAEHARTVTLRIKRTVLMLGGHGRQLLGIRTRMETDACVIVHREIIAAQHAKMFATIWFVMPQVGRKL